MEQENKITLKERQQEVLLLSVCGLNALQISDELCISERTVNIYCGELLKIFKDADGSKSMKITIRKVCLGGLLPLLIEKHKHRFGKIIAAAGELPDVSI